MSSRVGAARGRARRAKAALAVGALGAFAVAIPLARQHYPGHPKHRPRPLDAPAGFRHTVQDALLRAGILGPAAAPSEAVTALS